MNPERRKAKMRHAAHRGYYRRLDGLGITATPWQADLAYRAEQAADRFNGSTLDPYADPAQQGYPPP